jgi:predicted nucleic acid-binding protein
MNAEPAREFIDTNILLYAFDATAGEKQTAALTLLERLWGAGTGCFSVQVLQEFFVNVTRKIAQPLSIEEARDRIREFSKWKIFAPDADDVLAAITLSAKAQLNFWDAMILHAAVASECGVLWSEDLKTGKIVRGVEIRNPFTE